MFSFRENRFLFVAGIIRCGMRPRRNFFPAQLSANRRRSFRRDETIYEIQCHWKLLQNLIGEFNDRKLAMTEQENNEIEKKNQVTVVASWITSH